MKKNKYIKEIASNLPVIVDQTVSGFYMDYDENGEEKMFPNIVNHPINHERRIRKAYESLGMEGVKKYLITIYNLQIKHNENLQNIQNGNNKELQDNTSPSLSEIRPADSEADV